MLYTSCAFKCWQVGISITRQLSLWGHYVINHIGVNSIQFKSDQKHIQLSLSFSSPLKCSLSSAEIHHEIYRTKIQTKI